MCHYDISPKLKTQSLLTHTSLSPIRREFAPGFVNYKKGCTRLAAASDKVYQLFAHGRWFSPGTPAFSTTKTGRHDIAEILLKVALNTKNQPINQSINQSPIFSIELLALTFSFLSVNVSILQDSCKTMKEEN
jgi:hypothetical protein